MKLCECGCGQEIPAFDKRGRARKFAKAHNKKIDNYKLSKSKKCNQCQKTLPMSDFSFRNEKRLSCVVQRPRSKCKVCECLNTKKWYSNPEVKVHRWEHRKQNRSKDIKYKLQDRIASWKKKTLDSDLTVDYLVDLWDKQKGFCYYTGIEMNWKANKIEKFGFSLDRLNPEKGYVQGNVVFCCYLANTMKWTHNEIEFYEFMEKILSYKGRL